MSKKSLHIKFIAFFVLLNFCLNGSNQTLYAQSVAQPAYPSSQVGVQVNLRESVRSLRLPEELGKIHELYLPHSANKKRDQFVIYLQGAHTNYDSETNTKKLIHFFQKRFGLNLVLLEGGEGRLDSLFFKSFPDQRLKEKILNEYLSKGDLSGGEISSILDDSFNTNYYGIETQVLYEENKSAFLEAIQNEEPISKILTQIKSKLLDQSKTDFSQHVRNFFEKKQLFSRDKIDLVEYVRFLSSLRGGCNDDYSELSKLLTTQAEEQQFSHKNFDIAMSQTLQAFQRKILPKLPKQVQMELNQMIQLHRIGHLNSGMLIEKAQKLSKEHNFFFTVPEMLKPVAEHTKTLSSIKGTKLFNELNLLEEELTKSLGKTEDEKRLLSDLRQVEILERFARLEIVHRDWQEIKGDIVPMELNSLFIPHLRFYELALKRDEAMFQNALKFMKHEKAKTVLISTGGFHSEGITQKLKQSKIGYIVISPTINQFSDRSIYLNAMEDKRSFMKYFNGSLWDALAQDYASKLAASLKQDDLTPSLKKWRDRIIQNSISEGRITQAGSYTKYVDALARAVKRHSERSEESRSGSFGLRPQDDTFEKDIRKELEAELNSFFTTYFDKIESLLKTKVQIFGDGLKDLWKTGEINPNSIGQLVDRMNAAQVSHIPPRISLIHNLSPSPDPDRGQILVSTKGVEGSDLATRSETRTDASPASLIAEIEKQAGEILQSQEVNGGAVDFVLSAKAQTLIELLEKLSELNLKAVDLPNWAKDQDLILNIWSDLIDSKKPGLSSDFYDGLQKKIIKFLHSVRPEPIRVIEPPPYAGSSSSTGSVVTQEFAGSQTVSTTNSKLADLFPYILRNAEIPKDKERLTPKEARSHGAVQLVTVNKKKSISYTASDFYTKKTVIPILRKTGDQEYSIGLEVMSPLTGEPFIISSYVFVRDGKVLTEGKPERSNLVASGKVPAEEVPFTTFLVIQELIYRLASGHDLPEKLQRLTKQGLEDKKQDLGDKTSTGLFYEKTVDFWRGLRINYLDEYPNPILTFERAPWLLPDNSTDIPAPWIAILWTRRGLDKDGNETRPEIPFSSIVVFSEKKFTTPDGKEVEAGYARTRPFVDGKKGLEKVKGEIPKAKRSFHDVFKILWNIYWLAGGIDRVPSDDVIIVKHGRDGYVFNFHGDIITIPLGTAFSSGTTIRSWITFPNLGSNVRGIRYQNIQDGQVKAEKFLVSFKNGQFQEPEEIEKPEEPTTIAEEKRPVIILPSSLPAIRKIARPLSISLETRFLLIRERQKVLGRLQQLDEEYSKSLTLPDGERLDSWRGLLGEYEKLLQDAEILKQIQLTGNLPQNEEWQKRFHFSRPEVSGASPQSLPENVRLLIRTIVENKADENTWREIQKQSGVFFETTRSQSQNHVYLSDSKDFGIPIGDFHNKHAILQLSVEEKTAGKHPYLRIRIFDPDHLDEPYDSVFWDPISKNFVNAKEEWALWFSGKSSWGVPSETTAAHITNTGRLYAFRSFDRPNSITVNGSLEMGDGFYEMMNHRRFYPHGTTGSGRRYYLKAFERNGTKFVTVYATPLAEEQNQMAVFRWVADDPNWKDRNQGGAGFEKVEDTVSEEMASHGIVHHEKTLAQKWISGLLPNYLEISVSAQITSRSKVPIIPPNQIRQGNAKVTLTGADLGMPISWRNVTETIAAEPTVRAMDLYDPKGQYYTRAFYSDEKPEGVNAFLEVIRRFKKFQRTISAGETEIPGPILYLKDSSKMSDDLELLDQSRGEGKGRGTNVFANALKDIERLGTAQGMEWNYFWVEFGIVEDKGQKFPAMYLMPIDLVNQKVIFGLRIVALDADRFQYNGPFGGIDVSEKMMRRILERGYGRNLNQIVYPEIIQNRITQLNEEIQTGEPHPQAALSSSYSNELVEAQGEGAIRNLQYPRYTNQSSVIIHYSFGQNQKSKTVKLIDGINPITLEESDAQGTATQIIHITLDRVPPEILNVQVPLKTNEPQITITYDVKDNVDGVFNRRRVVQLHEGSNSVVLEATDRAGNKTSLPLEIILDTKAPEIFNIHAPQKTNREKITITYMVRDEGDRTQKKYTKDVSLIEGENRIILEAKDEAGNLARVSVLVVYEPSKRAHPSRPPPAQPEESIPEAPSAPPSLRQSEVVYQEKPVAFQKLDETFFMRVPTTPTYTQHLKLLRELARYYKVLKNQNLKPEISSELPEPNLAEAWTAFRKSFRKGIRPTPALIYRPANYPWGAYRPTSKEGRVFQDLLRSQIQKIQKEHPDMKYFWIEMGPAFSEHHRNVLRAAFYVTGVDIKNGAASPIYRFFEKDKDIFPQPREIHIEASAFSHPVFHSMREFGYLRKGSEADFASLVQSRLGLISRLVKVENVIWDELSAIDTFLATPVLTHLEESRRANGAASLSKPASVAIHLRDYSVGLSLLEVPFLLHSQNLAEIFARAHEIASQENLPLAEQARLFLHVFAFSPELGAVLGYQSFRIGPVQILESQLEKNTAQQDELLQKVRELALQIAKIQQDYHIELKPLSVIAETQLRAPEEPEEQPVPVEEEPEPAPETVAQTVHEPEAPAVLVETTELVPAPAEARVEPAAPLIEETWEERGARELEEAKTNSRQALDLIEGYMDIVFTLHQENRTSEASRELEQILSLLQIIDEVHLESLESTDQLHYYWFLTLGMAFTGAGTADLIESLKKAEELLAVAPDSGLEPAITSWKKELEAQARAQKDAQRKREIDNQVKLLQEQLERVDSMETRRQLVTEILELNPRNPLAMNWHKFFQIRQHLQDFILQIETDDKFDPKRPKYKTRYQALQKETQTFLSAFADSLMKSDLTELLDKINTHFGRAETRSSGLPSVAVTFGPFDGPTGKKIRQIIREKLLEFDPKFETTAGEDILNGIAFFYGGTEHNLAQITVGTLKKHYDETIKDQTSPYKKIKFLYNFPVEQLSYDPKSAEDWINQILKQLKPKFGVQKFEIVPDETDPLENRKRLKPHTLKRNSIFYFETPIEEGAPTLLIFEKLEKNVLSFRSPFKEQTAYSIPAAEFNQRVRISVTDPKNEISLVAPTLEGTTLEMPALSTGKAKSPKPPKIPLVSEPTVLKAFTGFLLPALERASSHRKRPVDSKLSAVEKLKQILTGQSPIRIEIVNEIEVVIEIFDKKQNEKVAQKQRIKLDHYVLDIKYEITGIDRTDEMSASMRLLVEKLIEGLSDKKIAEINQSGGFGQRIVDLYEKIISEKFNRVVAEQSVKRSARAEMRAGKWSPLAYPHLNAKEAAQRLMKFNSKAEIEEAVREIEEALQMIKREVEAPINILREIIQENPRTSRAKIFFKDASDIQQSANQALEALKISDFQRAYGKMNWILFKLTSPSSRFVPEIRKGVSSFFPAFHAAQLMAAHEQLRRIVVDSPIAENKRKDFLEEVHNAFFDHVIDLVNELSTPKLKIEKQKQILQALRQFRLEVKKFINWEVSAFFPSWDLLTNRTQSIPNFLRQMNLYEPKLQIRFLDRAISLMEKSLSKSGPGSDARAETRSDRALELQRLYMDRARIEVELLLFRNKAAHLQDALITVSTLKAWRLKWRLTQTQEKLNALQMKFSKIQSRIDQLETTTLEDWVLQIQRRLLSSTFFWSPLFMLEKQQIGFLRRKIESFKRWLKIRSILKKGFTLIRSVGTLDEIWRMDKYEFAKRLGAKPFEDPKKEAAPLFVITPRMWQAIQEYRQGRAGLFSGQEVTLSKRPEVDSPGIYFNPEMDRQGMTVSKASFVHEIFEWLTFLSGLVDQDLLNELQDGHLLVLEAQLRFASLFGEQEFGDEIRYVKGKLNEINARLARLKELEKSPEGTMALVSSDSDPRKNGLSRIKSELEQLLSEAKTEKFKKRSQRLWNSVSRIVFPRSETRSLPELRIRFLNIPDAQKKIHKDETLAKKDFKNQLSAIQKLIRIVAARSGQEHHQLHIHSGQFSWSDKPGKHLLPEESRFDWLIVRSAKYPITPTIYVMAKNPKESWVVGHYVMETAAIPDAVPTPDLPYGNFESRILSIDKEKLIDIYSWFEMPVRETTIELFEQALKNEIEKYFVYGNQILYGKLESHPIGRAMRRGSPLWRIVVQRGPDGKPEFEVYDYDPETSPLVRVAYGDFPAVHRAETRETQTFEYFAEAVKAMIHNRATVYKHLVSTADLSDSSSSAAKRLKRLVGLLKKDLPGMVSRTGNPIKQLYDLYEQSLFMKGDPDHDDRPYLTTLKKFIENKKNWLEDETLVQRASQIAFEYYLYQAISLLAFDAYREWRENTKPDRDEQARENIRAVEDLLQQFQSGSLQKFDTDPLLSLEFLSSHLSFYQDEYRVLEEFVKVLGPEALARWDEYEARLIGRHLRGVFYDPFRDEEDLLEHRFLNISDFATLLQVLTREITRYHDARIAGDKTRKLRYAHNIMEALSSDPEFMTSYDYLSRFNSLTNTRRSNYEGARLYPLNYPALLEKYEQLLKGESGFLADDIKSNLIPDQNDFTPLGRADLYWPELAKYMVLASILNPGLEDLGFRDLLEAEQNVLNAEKSRKRLWMIPLDEAKRYLASSYDILRNYSHDRAQDRQEAVVEALRSLQKKAQFEKHSETRSPKSIRLLNLDQFTRLEQFIIKHKYPNGIVSDGTIYLDTPLDASMRIFGEYQTYFGSLVGRNYFSFGPGAVLTDSLTAAMLEMHVTAVEKDKKIFDYAEQVKNLAEKEGLIGAGKFNLINQDAFSVSWSDQDIIFFFYTQSRFDTAKYRAEFNRKLEGKIKEMKPSAVLALLFTGSQLMAEQDDYLALESLEERRVQVSDHLTGLYLLTFQKPLGVRAETRSTENVAGHLINRLYSGDLERREKLQVIQDLGRAKVDVARRVLEAELKVAAEDPEADDEIRAALLLALQNYESREKDQLNKRDEEIVLKALGEIDQAYEVYQKESRQQWVKLFLQKVIEMLRKFFDFFNTEINWLNDLHDTFSKPFISFKTAEAHQALALYNSFRTQSQYHLPRNSVDLERNLKPGSLIISFNPNWISAALYVAVGKVTLKDSVGESYETWLFADYSPKGLPVQISEATTVRDFYGPFRADFTILLPPTKIFDPMIQRSAREIQRFLKKPFRRLRSELRSGTGVSEFENSEEFFDVVRQVLNLKGDIKKYLDGKMKPQDMDRLGSQLEWIHAQLKTLQGDSRLGFQVHQNGYGKPGFILDGEKRNFVRTVFEIPRFAAHLALAEGTLRRPLQRLLNMQYELILPKAARAELRAVKFEDLESTIYQMISNASRAGYSHKPRRRSFITVSYNSEKVGRIPLDKRNQIANLIMRHLRNGIEEGRYPKDNIYDVFIERGLTHVTVIGYAPQTSRSEMRSRKEKSEKAPKRNKSYEHTFIEPLWRLAKGRDPLDHFDANSQPAIKKEISIFYKTFGKQIHSKNLTWLLLSAIEASSNEEELQENLTSLKTFAQDLAKRKIPVHRLRYYSRARDVQDRKVHNPKDFANYLSLIAESSENLARRFSKHGRIRLDELPPSSRAETRATKKLSQNELKERAVQYAQNFWERLPTYLPRAERLQEEGFILELDRDPNSVYPKDPDLGVPFYLIKAFHLAEGQRIGYEFIFYLNAETQTLALRIFQLTQQIGRVSLDSLEGSLLPYVIPDKQDAFKAMYDVLSGIDEDSNGISGSKLPEVRAEVRTVEYGGLLSEAQDHSELSREDRLLMKEGQDEVRELMKTNPRLRTYMELLREKYGYIEWYLNGRSSLVPFYHGLVLSIWPFISERSIKILENKWKRRLGGPIFIITVSPQFLRKIPIEKDRAASVEHELFHAMFDVDQPDIRNKFYELIDLIHNTFKDPTKQWAYWLIAQSILLDNLLHRWAIKKGFEDSVYNIVNGRTGPPQEVLSRIPQHLADEPEGKKEWRINLEVARVLYRFLLAYDLAGQTPPQEKEVLEVAKTFFKEHYDDFETTRHELFREMKSKPFPTISRLQEMFAWLHIPSRAEVRNVAGKDIPTQLISIDKESTQLLKDLRSSTSRTAPRVLNKISAKYLAFRNEFLVLFRDVLREWLEKIASDKWDRRIHSRGTSLLERIEAALPPSNENELFPRYKPNEAPKVAVIIPIYNKVEDPKSDLKRQSLRDNLLSLQTLHYPPEKVEVFVIDNGSPNEDFARQIKGGFPWVRMLRSSENLGFAGGINLGIWEARKSGAQYFFLINDDTYVNDPNVLTKLLRISEQTGIGFVGMPLVNPRRGEWIQVHGLHGPVRLKGKAHTNQYEEVKGVAGSAFLVSQKVIDQVGLMDERFFLYFEESDWNARAQAQPSDLKNVLAKTTRMVHKEEGGGVFNANSAYYLVRNSVFYARRNLTGFYYHVIWPLSVFLSYVISGLRGRENQLDSRSQIIWNATRGLIDGYRGRWQRPPRFFVTEIGISRAEMRTASDLPVIRSYQQALNIVKRVPIRAFIEVRLAGMSAQAHKSGLPSRAEVRTDPDQKSLKSFLMSKLEKKGWNQNHLAKAIGRNRSQVTRFFNEETVPDLDTSLVMGRVLDFDGFDFFTDYVLPQRQRIRSKEGVDPTFVTNLERALRSMPFASSIDVQELQEGKVTAGQFIIQKRQATRVNLADLEKNSGIHKGTLSRIEHNLRLPNLEQSIVLGKLLGAAEIRVVPENGMTPRLTHQDKAGFLKGTNHTSAGNLWQIGHQAEIATSLIKMRVFERLRWSSLIDQRYNLIAFLILDIASRIVSPWLAQPGRLGTYTEYPPPASFSRTTLYFIVFYPFSLPQITRQIYNTALGRSQTVHKQLTVTGRRAEVRKVSTRFFNGRNSPLVVAQLRSEWAKRNLDNGNILNQLFDKTFNPIESLVKPFKTFAKRAEFLVYVLKDYLKFPLARKFGIAIRSIGHFDPFSAGVIEVSAMLATENGFVNPIYRRAEMRTTHHEGRIVRKMEIIDYFRLRGAYTLAQGLEVNDVVQHFQGRMTAETAKKKNLDFLVTARLMVYHENKYYLPAWFKDIDTEQFRKDFGELAFFYQLDPRALKEKVIKLLRPVAARNYLIQLGTDFNSLVPPKIPEIAPLILEGSRAVESRKDFERRVVPKVQKLARLLKTNVGIHVLPSQYLPFLTQEDFDGNSYILTPDVLQGQGIADDPEKAKDFLDHFENTFFGTLGFGFKTQQDRIAIPLKVRAIPQGLPALPVALFIEPNSWELKGKGLSNGYFIQEHVRLLYGFKDLFEDRLLGLVQWKFEEIEGENYEILHWKIAEKYIDKLLEIAEKQSGADQSNADIVAGRAEVRNGIKVEQSKGIDPVAIREIVEEIMSPNPDIPELTGRLRQLHTARAEVRDVIDEIEKAIKDVMKEKREQRSNVVARLSGLQGFATTQSVAAVFTESGIPIYPAAIPGSIERFVGILNAQAENESAKFSEVDLSRNQLIANRIVDFNQLSLIEIRIPEQFKLAQNPREHFKHFLETASQLVLNENIAVRVHIKGISKLASRFERNSNDPFSVVINHDDRLIIFNGKIQNFDPFFHMPASIMITSESNQVPGSRLMSDFYATDKTAVVFGNDVNVLSEFLMGAAIKLTQQTHEALVAYDQRTYRLTGPGALELMLHTLAEKTKQRLELAVAA